MATLQMFLLGDIEVSNSTCVRGPLLKGPMQTFWSTMVSPGLCICMSMTITGWASLYDVVRNCYEDWSLQKPLLLVLMMLNKIDIP